MRTGQADTFPRLLADIGGTNARFALQTPDGIAPSVTLACADFPTLQDAITQALQRAGGPAVRHAAIAIANPVLGDAVRMTNHHWAFSIAALRDAMRWNTLLVLNDFTALALALPELKPEHLRQIGGGAPVAGTAIGLLGAGTGLGVSGLIPGPDGTWLPLAGEGGHVSVAPFDACEIDLWRYAQARFGHVSAERLLSGPGLQLIHAWLSESDAPPAAGPSQGGVRPLGGQQGQSPSVGAVHHPAAAPSPADITARALQGTDARCVQTVDLFCALLGTVAANLALTLGATGGVFIGGGIVPKLGAAFARSGFRARFENKGRFSGYLARIPVFVIHHPDPAFLGVARALEHHLTQSTSP
jgi:glucokinase